MTAEEILAGWTVFDHPTDYPDYFVARRWILRRDGTVTHTATILRSNDLEELRSALCDANPNLVYIGRMDHDDAKIIEVWI